MDNPIFQSIYARVCMGAGLAALSGVRAFLPVAFLALYSRLEFFSAPVLEGTPFAFLEKTWVIILLFALAAVELVTDKFPGFASLHRQIMRPIRIALGGLVFAVAMAPDGWLPMVICAIAGLLIAFLAEHATHSMRPGTPEGTKMETAPFVLLSLYADVAVLVGTLLFVLVPLIGALFACLMFLFVYRLRQRRRRKHKGLRILKG
jgi:uncharacterized membrane protein